MWVVTIVMACPQSTHAHLGGSPLEGTSGSSGGLLLFLGLTLFRFLLLCLHASVTAVVIRAVAVLCAVPVVVLGM